MLHAAHTRILGLASSALVLFGLATCSATVGSRHGVPAQDITQLIRQAHAWDQAIVRKDLAGITGNMTEDFRQIDDDADISYDGKAFASHYRYIDMYVRTNGVWKIASVQITRMPKVGGGAAHD